MLSRESIIAFACGAALIGIGFERLAAGSMTLAPFLLVLGYCAAIPVAIMLGGGKNREAAREPAGESGE
ncbi:MAG: hypothetical protein GF405_01200 [Candidatus Eisenbacteria bacterium]|nr:hypothetical protein [Candidatus Eisenbacteria bacterium]